MKLSFLLSFFLTIIAYAEDAPVFESVAKYQAVTADGVGLNYIELLNAQGKPITQGQPVLLMHGLGSNFNIFKSMAEDFRRRGFRVFLANWRGHGAEDNRSVVLGEKFNSKDPRYEFENVAVNDVSTLVDAVYGKTGKKLVYVSHSMGTMIGHLAFGGLAKAADGKLSVSQEKIEDFEQKVAAFVPMGGPIDLKIRKRDLIALALLELLKNNILCLFAPAQCFDKGVLNMDNITDEEYDHMRKKSGSQVPGALFSSVVRMYNNTYGSADGTLDYNKISLRSGEHTSRIPTLVVSAQLDVLAPLARQAQLATALKSRFLILKDYGHYDLIVSSRSNAIIVEEIIKLLKKAPLVAGLRD